jgi:hypothetical protein
MVSRDMKNAYSTAISDVDLVDEIDCVVMLVWCPGQYFMTTFLQGINDHVNSAEYGRVRKDLFGQSIAS